MPLPRGRQAPRRPPRLARARTALLAAGLAAVAAALHGASSGLNPLPDVNFAAGYLGHCNVEPTQQKTVACFVRDLLAEIERSGDPASELPRIDRAVRASGGFLAWNCHSVMHEVGRQFARRNHVTLATLQSYVPKSDDPNCSAGFGMGMVMHLGPTIVGFGSEAAARACSLPNRFREYTCVHGLGHAYMRVYHGDLGPSLDACKRLELRNAADCAQGAYHDHWISLNGADGTTARAGAIRSPRVLCARPEHLRFVRACWYRAFVERPPAFDVATPAEIRRLCHGLRGLQRSACVSAAALIASADPFRQMELCTRLPGEDAASCVRAVLVHGVAASPAAQLRLISSCARMPVSGELPCYEWLGKALAVVTDGAFACSRLGSDAARAACDAGARRMDHALITFS